MQMLRQYKITITKLILLFCISVFLQSFAHAQSTMEFRVFRKFIGKNYVIAPELKTNCEWMYAIVKVQTNTQNKITGYSFVNNPDSLLKNGFKFLLGYQFPKNLEIKKRPVIFYFTIENQESWIEKDGDLRFYAPNRVASIIASYYLKFFNENRNSIFIPGLITKFEMPKQYKD